MEPIINLLFPRRCPVCQEIVRPAGELICPSCLKQLSPVREPVCKKCGKELTADTAEYCFDCTRHRRSFEYGRALLNYNEPAARSMAQIKYHNKREYLDFYAGAISRRLGGSLRRMNAQALVPVPVHSSRRKVRGFNQAEELASRLSRQLQIPMKPELLKRSRKTAPQKDLDPAHRLKNLEEAFEASPEAAAFSSIILVDDIYTTGSTIEACSRVLKKAGVARVYFVTICIGGG